MSSYKVIQDIEAEDKLLGPLTLRQFIYAGIAVLCFYLTFLVATKGALFLGAVFLPVGGVSGFLAWPWSRDQPTEVWALAKIRFMIKPRKRIWDQSGTKELVTVTAPKKIEEVYTNGLSQTEVESRLRALADMIDSRGWAAKNIGLVQANSDRLISANSLPSLPALVEDNIGINSDDDMLEAANPVARQFDSMIAKSAETHRAELLQQMSRPEPPVSTAPPTTQPTQPANNYWFLNQPTATPQVPTDATVFGTQVVTPTSPNPPMYTQPQVSQPLPTGNNAINSDAITTEQEQALINQLRAEEAQQSKINPFGHYHTVMPLSDQPASNQPVAPSSSVPTASSPPTTPTAIPIPSALNFNGNSGLPGYPAIDPVNATAQPSSAITPLNATQQVTAPPDPAILRLASNDDLDVATIAREANKHKESQDEVVISLH